MTGRIKNMTAGCNVTIAAGFPKAFLDFAVSKGADGPTLIARANIRPDDITDPDNRVPLTSYMRLMQAAVEWCNEPALALQFGEAVRLADISIMGLVGHTETAEESRQQANRFARLAIDDGNGETSPRVEFVPEDGNVWLKFSGTIYSENQLLTESILARCVCDGRAFAATHRDNCWPNPKAIRFSHAEPSYRAEYDRIFGMPLEFSSGMNGIMFGEELLRVRIAPPGKYVSRLANRQAEALLGRLNTSSSVRDRVEELMKPVLHTGEVSVETIAGKLGVSRQTLFRQLKAEGVTFKQVHDELRYQVALAHLKSETAVNETAYLVGFSDPAAFSRAFKRWTGTSPRSLTKRKE